MSISQKFKEWVAPIDDDEILEVVDDEAPAISEYEAPKSKNVGRVPMDTKMVLFEPRSFDEAEEVAKRLKENRAAVINLHKDGSIQKIGHNVILCAPRNIGVHGNISLDANEDE